MDFHHSSNNIGFLFFKSSLGDVSATAKYPSLFSSS